jgi:hypothetical protein
MMIDADYTACDGVGTLTVTISERELASQLRDAFFAIQAALQAGQSFTLRVEAKPCLS